MSTAPVITIFVRHAADCRYRGDEFEKRCRCRKHFRWTANREQHRQKAGTRSWAEAEELKRKLEDQLAGRTPEPQASAGQEMTLRKVIEAFDASKEAQGVKPAVRAAYALQLNRLLNFCEGRALYTPTAALTLENLLAFRATWTTYHKSSYSRHVVQAYLKHFLNFTFNAGWIPASPNCLQSRWHNRRRNRLRMPTMRRSLTPCMQPWGTSTHALAISQSFSSCAGAGLPSVTRPR